MNLKKTDLLLMIGSLINVGTVFFGDSLDLELKFLFFGMSVGFIISYFLVRYWIVRGEASQAKQKTKQELAKLKKEFNLK